MPRYQLPRTPKGFRQPGSGRPKRQPNRITVEARTLVSELINNVNYQHTSGATSHGGKCIRPLNRWCGVIT